jgi:hypothetical protein
MAKDKPNQGWRKAAASSGQNKPGQRGWQQDPAKPARATPSKLTKKTKLALAIGSLVVVLCLLIAVVLWPRGVKPVRFVLIGAGYEETHLAVPPNALGRSVQRDLEEWARIDPLRLEVRSAEVATQGDPYLEALKDARGAPSVVLFINAFGGADSSGPYLLPRDASLREPDKSRQRLDKLFDQLKLLPSDMKKLVLFDTQQVPAAWDLGLVHNDFSRAVMHDPRLKEINNLLVISACDEDQLSWPSEDWHRSIFAHFVIEGLRGAADEPQNGGDGNDRVTAAELFRYVQKNVRNWTRHNREALQEPAFVGDMQVAENLELVLVPPGRGYVGTDPMKLPEFMVPGELTEAWKACQELAKRSPSPVVYAPQIWRQYLDTLLRAERLFRCDDKEGASAQLNALAGLRDRILQAQALDRDSYQNALTLSSAFGRDLTPAVKKKLTAEFDKLWENREMPEAFKKLKEQTQASLAEKWQKQLVRVRFSGLVLDKITQDPTANLNAGCSIVAALDEVLNPRPAEVHFAIMLQRDLAEKRPPADVLTRALKTRQLAEEAALGTGNSLDGKEEHVPPCCEQVHPWIRLKVEEGDRKRRLAQDLLFAGDGRSWEQAGALLAEAQQAYESAQADALPLRKALQARDLALVALPYYTQWLAQQRTADELVDKQLLPLWDEVHALRKGLDVPDAKPAPEKIKDLANRAESVRKGLAQLDSAFKRHADQLTSASLQKGWHDIEAALAVPFLDADLRRQLLQKSRQISYTLNVEGANKASEAGGLTKEQNAQMMREMAQRQARLALAMLGEDEFKRQQAPVSFTDVDALVKRPDEVQWWRSLLKAGEQIGQRLTQMPADAERLADEGRQSDLEKASDQLRTAASLSHRLGAAGAATFLSDNPVVECRRLQTHDLLVDQGERTFQDYFASEEARQPYYRAAGLSYVRDALDLAGKDAPNLTREQKDRRLRRAQRLERQLNAPDTFEVQLLEGAEWKPSPATLDLTEDKPEERVYRVRAPANVPDGYPVVWSQPGKHLALTGPAKERLVLDLIGAKRQEVQVPPLSLVQAGVSASGDKSEQVLHAVYRGRRFQHRSDVFLYQRPDLVLFQPEMPRTARVAVQVEPDLKQEFGADKAALAIVLDCSGSMNAKKPGDSERRFDKATKALEEVLDSLPPGVTVSLRVFAHVDDEFTSNNPRQIPIRLLREPSKWKKNDVGPLMRRVRNLTPAYETPLVRALWMARDDFPAGFKGTKTIVVLTDGADNQFDTAADADLRKRGQTIREFLRNEFKDSGVTPNVVGLEVTETEKKQQQEFVQAIQALGGRYFEVDDSTKLAATLKKAVLQMHFWMEAGSGAVPPGELPEEGADISTVGQNLRWISGLTPGTYDVRVRTNRDVEQNIGLAAGDSLTVNLIRKGDGLGFQRDVYAESHYFRQFGRLLKKQPQNDWLLAVMQNQRFLATPQSPEGLQIMTTLEKLEKAPVHRTTQIRQVKPRFTWFQVSGPDGKETASIRYYPLYGYPAPAWSLDLTPWPRGNVPTLSAWWSPELSADAQHVVRHDVEQFKSVLELANRDITVLDQDEKLKVSIESVRAQKLLVEATAPSEFGKRGAMKDVDCLVVRLRYPPGKPFLAQLPDTLNSIGQEHRFYTKAGKYTGIFWNVSEEQARDVKSLTLVSVETAKKKALRLEKLELGAPDAMSRPQKPRE